MSKYITQEDAEYVIKSRYNPLMLGISYLGLSDLQDMLEEIKTCTEWILCSESMPKNFENVLVSHKGGVTLAWYNGVYWTHGASTKHRPIKTVVAWMPLPDPYKGGNA